MAKNAANKEEMHTDDQSVGSFSVCRSGPECLGPNKPARFSARNPLHQDSIRTGYCAACRNAGKGRDNFKDHITSHQHEDVPIFRLLGDEEISSPHIRLLTQEDLDAETTQDFKDSWNNINNSNLNTSLPELVLREDDSARGESISDAHAEFPSDFFNGSRKSLAQQSSINSATQKRSRNERVDKIPKQDLQGNAGTSIIAPSRETPEQRAERNLRSEMAVADFHQKIVSGLSRTISIFTPPSSLVVSDRGTVNLLGVKQGGMETLKSAKFFVTGIGRSCLAATGVAALIVGGSISTVGWILPIPFVRSAVRALGRVVWRGGRRGVLALAPGALQSGSTVPVYAGAATIAGLVTVAGGVVTFPWSIAVVAAGPLAGGSHLSFSGIRGFLLGRRKDPGWMSAKDWTDTTGLSTLDIKNKNDNFERVTNTCFSRLGYKTTLGGTQNREAIGNFKRGDGGIDVLVEDSHGARAVVSCKRYADKVQVDEVYELEGIKRRRGMNSAVLVTTIGFTEDARAAATDLGISLVTIEQLYDLAARYAY